MDAVKGETKLFIFIGKNQAKLNKPRCNASNNHLLCLTQKSPSLFASFKSTCVRLWREAWGPTWRRRTPCTRSTGTRGTAPRGARPRPGSRTSPRRTCSGRPKTSRRCFGGLFFLGKGAKTLDQVTFARLPIFHFPHQVSIAENYLTKRSNLSFLAT